MKYFSLCKKTLQEYHIYTHTHILVSYLAMLAKP